MCKHTSRVPSPGVAIIYYGESCEATLYYLVNLDSNQLSGDGFYPIYWLGGRMYSPCSSPCVWPGNGQCWRVIYQQGQ